MPPVNMNNKTTAHYLVSEAKNIYRSRDEVTVTGGTEPIRAGTILGTITATGKRVPLNLTAETGAQTVSGILFEEVPGAAAAKDHRRTVTARDSEVVKAQLVYPAGANATQITAIDAALRGLGIIPR